VAWLLAGCSKTSSGEGKPASGIQALEEKPAPVLIAEVELSNPSNFSRESSPIYLSYYDLGLTPQDQRVERLSARVGHTEVPSQGVDEDADGAKDGLVALVNFKPGEALTLTVSIDAGAQRAFPKRTQAEIAHKVGGEWKPREKDPTLQEYVGGTFQNVQKFTPPPQHMDHSNLIRYEGPGIESDKVGYRIYLDARNGFDIFGKKTPEPVLGRVGLDGYESYHHMSDWGMDILKVGLSLGAGGFGFYSEKGIELVSKVSGWDATIVENGPVYSAFGIKYKGWEVSGKPLDVQATFSMWGGSRRVQTRLGLSEPLPALAVGVVKHEGTELIVGSANIPGKAYTYVGSWGKQSLNGDQLGMAVLFERGALRTPSGIAQASALTGTVAPASVAVGAPPKAALSASRDRTAPATLAADKVVPLEDAANYAVALEPAGTELSYHFLAAWEGEPGGIKTREEFAQYLEREAEGLTLLPRQRLKTTLSKQAKVFPLTADSARDWAKKLADSELDRKTLSYKFDGWDGNRGRKPKFEYDVVGLQPLAYEELNQIAPDPRYARVVEQVSGSYVTDEGNIREYDEHDYNIDSIAPGRNLLSLFATTSQEKYKKAAGLLRRQLSAHPKTTEGAFWHKKRYPSQLWLDGVYMGMPFLARYSSMFESGESLDEVVNEFVIARKRLRDPKTGLYAHAWDEKKQQSWADPQTGLSKHPWGRGLGWFSMAVVDVLDYIPETDQERRAPLLEIVAELARALVKYQDAATRTWWQIMDQPAATGNYRESTASAMFTYFLAKAVRKGYLPASYRQTAVDSYQGVIEEFITVHPDGKVSMTNQCLVAGLGYGRDGSYHYYMSEPVWKNDPKGNGPFILAGVEIHRLLKS
jgi:rhamnogalacturonyl hydrolase YesR